MTQKTLSRPVVKIYKHIIITLWGTKSDSNELYIPLFLFFL